MGAKSNFYNNIGSHKPTKKNLKAIVKNTLKELQWGLTTIVYVVVNHG